MIRTLARQAASLLPGVAEWVVRQKGGQSDVMAVQPAGHEEEAVAAARDDRTGPVADGDAVGCSGDEGRANGGVLRALPAWHRGYRGPLVRLDVISG